MFVLCEFLPLERFSNFQKVFEFQSHLGSKSMIFKGIEFRFIIAIILNTGKKFNKAGYMAIQSRMVGQEP